MNDQLVAPNLKQKGLKALDRQMLSYIAPLIMDISERRAFLRGDMLTAGNRVGTVKRTAVSAVEVWTECFGRDPAAIRRSDTYDIFGMLMKIGGWEKYTGNKNGLIRRPPYGPQRCYVRAADRVQS